MWSQPAETIRLSPGPTGAPAHPKVWSSVVGLRCEVASEWKVPRTLSNASAAWFGSTCIRWLARVAKSLSTPWCEARKLLEHKHPHAQPPTLQSGVHAQGCLQIRRASEGGGRKEPRRKAHRSGGGSPRRGVGSAQQLAVTRTGLGSTCSRRSSKERATLY